MPRSKAELAALVAPAEAVFLDAKIESELIDLDPDGRRRAARVDRPGRVGPRPARPHRLRHARPADLPHRRPQGVARLDDPQGLEGPAGRRRHPHRLRARLHQGRGHLVRRPRRDRLGRRGARQGQGPHGGQGLRHAGRRRGGVPLQRVRSAPLAFLVRLRHPLHDGGTALALRGFRLAAGLRHGFLGGSGRRGDLLLAWSRKRIPNLVSWVSPCRVKSGCPTSVSSFSIDE